MMTSGHFIEHYIIYFLHFKLQTWENKTIPFLIVTNRLLGLLFRMQEGKRHRLLTALLSLVYPHLLNLLTRFVTSAYLISIE
jgi:hypothetical protein